MVLAPVNYVFHDHEVQISHDGANLWEVRSGVYLHYDL